MRHAASEEARERDRIRKKLKRSIEREEKKLQKAGLNRSEIESNKNVQNMKKLLAESYYDKTKKTYNIKNEVIAPTVDNFAYYQTGRGMRQKRKGKPNETMGEYYQRSNKQFEHEINQATLKEGVSILNAVDVHMFYKVTQPLWHNATGSQMKNVSILKGLGTPDLQTAYDILINPDENNKAQMEYLGIILKALYPNTTVEDYLYMLKRTKEVSKPTEGIVSDTQEIQEAGEDKERYSNYMALWSAFLASASGSD